MQNIAPLNATAQSFLRCLDASQRVREPYRYWLLHDILPRDLCRTLNTLPFPAPDTPVHSGRRESNNSTRVYFSPDVQDKYPAARELAAAFHHPAVKKAIVAETGTDLTRGQLRIEYCQDVDGFWLEPHVDIAVKLYTMLIYLSDDPNLRDAGTDVYDTSPEHKLVASAPYEQNAGLIFIPGPDTWHGFTSRPIRGLRKSIIINYVAPSWRAREELA